MLSFQEICLSDSQRYTLWIDGSPRLSFVSPSAMGDYVGTAYGEGIVLAERGTIFRYEVRPLGGGHYVLDLCDGHADGAEMPLVDFPPGCAAL